MTPGQSDRRHDRRVERRPGRGPLFVDRADAGARLAEQVLRRDWHHPVVLGLPRGGVPVAAEVATALDAPLDVAVARKIGAPGRAEFGIGAVTADGPAIYDQYSLSVLGLDPHDLRSACERERAEAHRRMYAYRRDAPPTPIAGRDVLLVDDGLATGVTARAAARMLRQRRPRRLAFAAPVCSRDGVAAIAGEVDEVIFVAAIVEFGAVGYWYRDFGQTSDAEVRALLAGQGEC